MMQINLHKDFSEIDRGEWNNLLAESITNTPFLRYEYLCAWWMNLGGGEWMQAELMLISARENGQLIGIAPLFLTEYEGLATLMLIGSIEISDYLDVIIRSADVARFMVGLIDFLNSPNFPAWHVLYWYNIPEASPTLAALKAESEKRSWSCTQEIYHPTPTIPLPANFEDYLASLEKKQRHEIRRKLRRAEESAGSVRWYLSNGVHLDSEIEALFSLMNEDPDKSGFLTGKMRDQLHATVHAAQLGGWLWLAFLEINGQKAAAALNFDYNGKLWGYNSGVSRALMNFSPGWVLLGYSLKWAVEHGRTEYDFMRGNEEYKYRFGAVNRYVMRVRVERMGVSYK